MQITCPNCSTHYKVSIGEFGAFRKKVRCSSCSNVWEVLPAQVLGVNRRAALVSPLKGSLALDENGEVKPNTSSIYTDERYSKDIKNKIKPKINSFQMLLVMAFIILAISMVIMKKEDLVQSIPISKIVFNSVGISTNFTGFEFKDVHIKRDIIEGELILTVWGKVINVSEIPSAVPIVNVILVDENEQAIYEWTTESNDENLYPNGQTEFITKLASPPLETKNVKVKFLTR